MDCDRQESSSCLLQEATIIRKAKTGESRGFGFVTYRNAADAQHVRMREHNVGGRHCDAKQALPRGTANPSRTTRLFIGRIPPGVTDIELRDYFEQFGKVQVRLYSCLTCPLSNFVCL